MHMWESECSSWSGQRVLVSVVPEAEETGRYAHCSGVCACRCLQLPRELQGRLDNE